MESKWLKWRMTHKVTGLTFNQYIQKHKVVINTGLEQSFIGIKCFPVLLSSGIPAIYVDQEYYPYLVFLRNTDWIIERKT